MQKILAITGTLAAIVGVLVCLAAGLTRVGGSYHLAGFEATTLFEVGAGLMIFACLMRLEELRLRQS